MLDDSTHWLHRPAAALARNVGNEYATSHGWEARQHPGERCVERRLRSSGIAFYKRQLARLEQRLEVARWETTVELLQELVVSVRNGRRGSYSIGDRPVAVLVGGAAYAILRESQDAELKTLGVYRQLLELVEGRSIALEEFARQMIYAEELHAAEVDKMLRKPGDIEALRPLTT